MKININVEQFASASAATPRPLPLGQYHSSATSSRGYYSVEHQIAPSSGTPKAGYASGRDQGPDRGLRVDVATTAGLSSFGSYLLDESANRPRTVAR